ncbi:MAG: glycosyltransferase family 4 protein [Anaerolineales bacterium]|nr:glycosyltransferase family 4 protein [Anaerolineales bacterium]
MLGKIVRKTLTRPGVATHLGWQSQLSAQATRLSYTTGQLNSVDLVVTQAQLVRDLVIKQGVDVEHIKLVPYGLSLNGKNSVVSSQSDHPFRIGYLGNLLPFKGAHMLVAAFKQLRVGERQVELYFYGDKNKWPDYTRRLQKLAANDPRIVFAGRYSNDEVGKILSTFDVLVVPSLWYEIGPLVTMEAFISKIPVVAANIPNMLYQVTHQVNGLLYEADSVEDLARQLQRLVDDPQLLTNLRRGISPVRSFEQEMNDWTEIYQSILTKRQTESLDI